MRVNWQQQEITTGLSKAKYSVSKAKTTRRRKRMTQKAALSLSGDEG